MFTAAGAAPGFLSWSRSDSRDWRLESVSESTEPDVELPLPAFQACVWAVNTAAHARKSSSVRDSVRASLSRAGASDESLAGWLAADSIESATLALLRLIRTCTERSGGVPPGLPMPVDVEQDEAAQRMEAQCPMCMSTLDYALLKQAHKTSVTPLSEPDKVTVKESWNKLLAWQDMAIEAFFLRWLALCGAEQMRDLLGDFFEETPDVFFGLFDLAVRALQPHTETVAREAYRPVHPSSQREFHTVHSYMSHFARLGIRPSHWQAAAEAWLYMFSSSVP